MRLCLLLAITLSLATCCESQASTFKSFAQFRKWAAQQGPEQAPGCAIPLPRLPLPDKLPGPLSSALESIPDLAKKALENYNVPGIGLAVVYGDTPLVIAGYGSANKSCADCQATGRTLFRMGSVTKVFTTLLFHVQRDAGLVASNDQPIDQIDPLFKVNNPYNRPITPRQLMAHLAGLPRSAPCLAGYTPCNFTSEEIYSRLATETLKLCPDSMPSYSNLGFAVLGQALASRSGKSWDALVKERVLDPLEMQSTGSTIPTEDLPRKAVGYDTTGRPQPDFDLGWEAAAGLLYSSPEDMAKFMSFFLQDDRSPFDVVPHNSTTRKARQSIVNPGTVGELFTNAFPFDNTVAIGRPWEMFYRGGYWWRTKGGDVPGFNTELVLVPEIGLGVLAFVNSDIATANDLAWNITDLVLPPLKQYLTSSIPAPAAPSNPQLYTGRYSLTAGFLGVNITVSQQGPTGLLHIDSSVISGWLVPPAGSPDSGTFRIMRDLPYYDEICLMWASGNDREEVVFSPSDPNAVKQSVTFTGLAYGFPARRIN